MSFNLEYRTLKNRAEFRILAGRKISTSLNLNEFNQQDNSTKKMHPREYQQSQGREKTLITKQHRYKVKGIIKHE